MLLIREVFHCKPGQVRPLVEKFKGMNKVMERMNLGKARIMTDMSAERYWTVVSEVEVESLEKHAEMTRKAGETKELQEAMRGYHDLVESGRREIYQIEK